MPLLNQYACRKRIDYTCHYIPKTARILEIGCGKGWFRDYCKANGWTHYTGIDLAPPADIVGDILDWKQLGLEENTFDFIVAFEVVEHVHCFNEMAALLKQDGRLILTSPTPHFDWLCKIMETLGLNQKRTSPHDHLIYFNRLPGFEAIALKKIGFLIQWGIFKKSHRDGDNESK
jgi:SAM-dependent methyltransferase